VAMVIVTMALTRLQLIKRHEKRID